MKFTTDATKIYHGWWAGQWGGHEWVWGGHGHPRPPPDGAIAGNICLVDTVVLVWALSKAWRFSHCNFFTKKSNKPNV